jgi:hypothetical protein
MRPASAVVGGSGSGGVRRGRRVIQGAADDRVDLLDLLDRGRGEFLALVRLAVEIGAVVFLVCLVHDEWPTPAAGAAAA